MKLKLHKDEIRPVISAKLGVMRIDTLIDSGAENSILYASDENMEFYTSSNILKETEYTITISGAVAGEEETIKQYIAYSLSIGDITLNNIYIGRSDRNKSCDLHLVLGYNVLRHFNYAIDNENRIFTINKIKNTFDFVDKNRIYRTFTEFVQLNSDKYILSHRILETDNYQLVEVYKYLKTNNNIKDQYEQLSIQYGFQDDPDPYLRVYRKLQKESFNNKK